MRWMFRIMNRVHPWLYRLRKGRGVDRVQGAPVLVVTTTGRKSGRPHTVVVSYVRDGEDLVLIGSAGGLPRHPAWALNLRDRPEGEAQLGGERFRVRSEWLAGEERERLWRRVIELHPFFGGYQQKTDRTLPLIRLRRMSAG
jgi:F420H(2)-dependent quinone reductase